MSKLSIEESRDLYFNNNDIECLKHEIDRFYDYLNSNNMTTTTTKNILLQAAAYYAGQHTDYICSIGGISCDILADGEVIFCCGSETSVGNVRFDTLHDIWHSKRAHDVRKRLLRCTECVDSCQADIRLRFSPSYLIRHSSQLLKEVLRLTR